MPCLGSRVGKGQAGLFFFSHALCDSSRSRSRGVRVCESRGHQPGTGGGAELIEFACIRSAVPPQHFDLGPLVEA